MVAFHCNGYLDPNKEPRLGIGRRFREELKWLRDLYGDVVEDAAKDDWPSPFTQKAMRLLLCSPEDADSIWFWQFIEVATTGFNTVPSEEIVKDMLNRYVPEYHGNKTPLQLAAAATAYHLPQHPPDKTRCLEVVIAAIIATGAGLHEGDHHHTPLLIFLTTIPGRKYWFKDSPSRPRDIQSGLLVWLKILHNAGVDLVTYGAEESRHFLAYRLLDSPVPPLLHWHNAQSLLFSDEVFYFTFTYGPTPEDWTVQLERVCDQYVGDFWQMPGLVDENEVLAMPGGWIDEV